MRLAAIREVLDRGLGKAPQAISVDLMMGKQLSEMSQGEMLEFKAKYVAMTTLAPAAIDQVIAAEEDTDPKSLELPLDSE